MHTTKSKAIFYAYSNNALDHLAPYVVLCHQKKIHCVVVYGEDFIKNKVYPKINITKIFKDLNIDTYDIANFEKKGFLQITFSYLWSFSRKIEKKKYIPNFLKNKIRGLCNRIYEHLDGKLIGKNTASNLLKDEKKLLIFTDHWDKKKKIQDSFLTSFKHKATIITTGHAVWHFHQPKSIEDTNFKEDIALLDNQWEAIRKSNINHKEILGNLRFSKKWINILDNYSLEKIEERDHKKNILIIAHNKKFTSDWDRMLNLFYKLEQRKDINLRILPHIRGMSNMIPPKKLIKVWDKSTSLELAIKKSDIVIFWVSSGFFEAVIRKKKILYLSFLSTLDGKFIWQKKAPNNIVIKNENELFNLINNYDNQKTVDNSCFNEIIWPNGDPWSNVSNFLDRILNTDKFN